MHARKTINTLKNAEMSLYMSIACRIPSNNFDSILFVGNSKKNIVTLLQQLHMTNNNSVKKKRDSTIDK